MMKRIFLAAMAAVVFCSCTKSTIYGTLQVVNNSSMDIHIESTFESADGNSCYSADLGPGVGPGTYAGEPNTPTCVLCKSPKYSGSRDIELEDVVTNASEGKVTVTSGGRVILEWTTADMERLQTLHSVWSIRTNFSATMEMAECFCLNIFDE